LSKNVAMFVDVANLYYSARGQDVDVDYVALLKHATKGRDLIRAYAYSGLDPENENQRKFIDFLGKNGYKVLTKDIRKFGDGRVKANLDIELVVDLFRLADRMDIAVIVSGDGDFAPAIKALQDKGIRCEVISFRPNTSSDLIAVADEFLDIMKIAGIGRGSGAKEAKADKGMSMPEMPAKEVVPEFGFRDASPSIAAAALSALRDGRDGRPASGGRGRPRGRGRAAEKTEAAAADAAPAAHTAPAAVEEVPAEPTNGDAATPEGRRRRRRRGGRGRGRGRGRTGPDTTEEGAPEPEREIGWVEVDDLSQLEDIDDLGALEGLDEEREYRFEEADAATLAELGLTPDAASPEPAASEATAKPQARRTRSRAKASDEQAAPAAAEKPKTTRRRSSTSGAASGSRSRAAKASGEPEAATAEEKPKTPRRRTRAAPRDSDPGGAEETAKPRRRRSASSSTADAGAGSPAEAAEGAESEGIWQRFRSGRTTTPKRSS
jgi:uncharacterized LabA/DUF88 family protein